MKKPLTASTTPPLIGHNEIAVTGATGFIGTTLIKQLSNAGWQVRALYRPHGGRVPPNLPGVKWIAGDLNNIAALHSLVADVNAVIHCAGAVRGASRADFDQINEAGALHVAQACAAQIVKPRFLLISTLAARMPELSHYAGSKWRGEAAIKTVAEDMRWTILRPPAVYGPGDRELLPLFKSMAKGFAPLPAGANGRFSLVHVEDLVAVMVRWLAQDNAYGQTFELDDGHAGGYDWDSVLDISGRVLRHGGVVRRIPIPITLLKLVAWTNFAAAKLFGYAPMLTPGKIREITHTDWMCDNSEIIRMTGWQPTIDLARGLANIFDKNHKKK
ncbi:MAG: NAD-dependent epimerase/dehydratase family protein [Methylotenera sp.]|nr:NAD-dependent epimerase/dehydratase family protein [Methylotenera sp.]MSP99816.1 NAD-dependent epimerase/dehydratase family protein [Methylotenera sp.]